MDWRDDMFRVGIYVNTHGVRGEIKLLPTTDDVERFYKDLPLVLDTGKEPIPVLDDGSQMQKSEANQEHTSHQCGNSQSLHAVLVDDTSYDNDKRTRRTAYLYF